MIVMLKIIRGINIGEQSNMWPIKKVYIGVQATDDGLNSSWHDDGKMFPSNAHWNACYVTFQIYE